MKKIFKIGFALLAVTSLSACGLIYQPVKNEGTIFDAQQVSQIAVGQTKDQVAYILGAPNVVKQFSQDVWYYVQRTVNSRGTASEKTFLVTFKDNKVISFGYQDPSSK